MPGSITRGKLYSKIDTTHARRRGFHYKEQKCSVKSSSLQKQTKSEVILVTSIMSWRKENLLHQFEPWLPVYALLNKKSGAGDLTLRKLNAQPKSQYQIRRGYQ